MARGLPGADMAGQGPTSKWSRYGTIHSMEQIWLASKLPGTDFLDKLPVVHLVAIFLACYGAHSVINKPHAKAHNSKNYVIDRALYFTCLTRNTARHCVHSECELQTFPATTANATTS